MNIGRVIGDRSLIDSNTDISSGLNVRNMLASVTEIIEIGFCIFLEE